MEAIIINLLEYQSQLDVKTDQDGQRLIKCLVRQRFFHLTPEEHVRQLLLHYLTLDFGWSKNLIQVEKQFDINGLNRRFDILLLTNKMEPKLLVECKAPSIKITQKTFDQISAYNIQMQVPFLLISNGRTNYLCKMDFDSKSFKFESDFILE